MTAPCITQFTNCSIHTFQTSLFVLLNTDVKGDPSGGGLIPSYSTKKLLRSKKELCQNSHQCWDSAITYPP